MNGFLRAGAPELGGELPPRRYVAIAVSDTGDGIPPDIVDRVYAATRLRHGWTGLLDIVTADA